MLYYSIATCARLVEEAVTSTVAVEGFFFTARRRDTDTDRGHTERPHPQKAD